MNQPKITTIEALEDVPDIAYGVADSGNGEFWFAVWVNDEGIPVLDVMTAPVGGRIYVEVPDSVDVRVDQHTPDVRRWPTGEG